MDDNFDNIFNSSEEIKIEKAEVKTKKVFKKLDDYKSDVTDVPARKRLKSKISLIKLKSLVKEHKSDIFKILIIITIIVSVSMFISAANNGKFQSSYSNNMTVESDTITCPTPQISNQYDFNPTTNVTVEAKEVNCNCNCDCSNQTA